MDAILRRTVTLLIVLSATGLWAQTEAEGDNVFLYGVSLASEYDDRTAGTPGTAGDFIYTVQPHIGFTVTRPRWETTLSYQPAFTYSIQHTSEYDLLSHSFGLTYGRRLTKRLRLDVQNTFTLTSNPFDAIRADASLPPTDVLDRPNSSLTGTVRSRRAAQALITVTQALSARSNVGMTGNFYHLEFRDGAPGSSGLTQRTLSGSGNVFYQYRLGKRSSMEARYEFLKLDFDHGAVKTDSHGLLYMWNFAPTSAVVMSLFAGPNYSITRSATAVSSASPVRVSQFSPVGGATISWTAAHTSLSASASQQIADGGGTRGSVRLDSFTLEAVQQLSRKNSIRGFANYNMNRLLVPASGASDKFNYFSVGGGFSRKVAEHASIGFSYWRIQQQETGLETISWNRVGITLSFEGERPIGRK